MDARKIFSEEELRAAYKRQNEETKRALEAWQHASAEAQRLWSEYQAVADRRNELFKRWYAELKRSGAAM